MKKPELTCAEGFVADDLAERFALLMMNNKDALYRYLFSMHPWVDEVDDLLQETALTLWRKIEKYDPEREFLPWAFRVAYFEVLKWRKHMRRRRFVLSEDLINSISDCAGEEEELEEAKLLALQDCMEKLPGKQREVVQQRYGHEGTVKELAESREISVHRMYHLLDHARGTLVDCVEGTLREQGFEICGG